jgi:hypothetical protein
MATTTAKTSIATERGILFSAPMVRALLDGSKTQTRRVVKDLPLWKITEICLDAGGTGKWMPNGPAPSGRGMAAGHWRACPYGQPGDRLWVRETFSDIYGAGGDERRRKEEVMYRADGETDPYVIGYRWTPSIHMPRWASRILLEITGVRVERLRDIGVEDIEAEGVVTSDEAIMEHGCRARVLDWQRLWESINGAGSWDANPWVWVVEFKRVLP